MKLKIYLRATLVAAGMITATSCGDFIDDNINPNLTTSTPPQLLLPAVEAALGFTMGSDLHRYSALWAQQLAAQNGRQTEAYDKYILQPTEINTVWRTNLYGGILADIEEILKKSPPETHTYYFGMAKAMKAFTYSLIVDYWGDVPYFQTMQGINNLQPDVDDDAVIYPALITLLDEAITNLKATSPATVSAPGKDDFIYSGKAAQWIKFANTLKLRLYLHMANVPGFDVSVISAFINNTPATEFMETIVDDFQHLFETSTNRQNPIHQFIVSRTNDICTSSTLIDLMNSKADPRRKTYFTPAPFSVALYNSPPTGTTGYKGLRNGFGAGLVDNSLSRIHTYVRGDVTTTASAIPAGPNLSVSGLAYNGGAPVNMLTFAEYNFIRAELALRYGAPGDAETFYRAGISASILDAGLTQTDADAYLASDPDGNGNPVGTLAGTAEEQLQQLIEEKFVANFAVTGEPWSDWRRTGYPLLQLLPATLSPGNDGKVPRALLYPQQEVDANPKLAAVQRTSLSDRRVFWDTRTTGQE